MCIFQGQQIPNLAGIFAAFCKSQVERVKKNPRVKKEF